jgi:hypothetical protein
MKSQSTTQQPLIQSYQGGLLISFNPVQKERTIMGGTETYWECDQIHLFGVPTKSAIKEAVKREMEAQRSVVKSKELEAFKVTQDDEYEKAMKEYRSTHKVIIADAKIQQTKDQKAGYLALLDFQEKLENEQAMAYSAKEAESGADYTKDGDLVATEVMNALNQ